MTANRVFTAAARQGLFTVAEFDCASLWLQARSVCHCGCPLGLTDQAGFVPRPGLNGPSWFRAQPGRTGPSWVDAVASVSLGGSHCSSPHRVVIAFSLCCALWLYVAVAYGDVAMAAL